MQSPGLISTSFCTVLATARNNHPLPPFGSLEPKLRLWIWERCRVGASASSPAAASSFSSASWSRGLDMSSTWSHGEATPPGAQSQDFDDAEKGLFVSTQSLPVLPPAAHADQKRPLHIDTNLWPTSPIHEGLTPFSSVPELSLAWPAGWRAPSAPAPEPGAKKPAKPKPKISRWILFQIWFNTYRKFFTFVTLLNLTGIIMAALNRFPYAENHLGALVLGNLLCAILMRNELFLRILYIIAIYGLRSVRLFLYHPHDGRADDGFVISGLH